MEYFKSLKYDALPAPNAALVIFREERAAGECLRRSPVRFRMGKAGVRHAGDGGGELGEGGRGEAEGTEESGKVRKEVALPRGPVGTPFGLPPQPQPQMQTRSLSTTSLPKPHANPIRMPFEPTTSTTFSPNPTTTTSPSSSETEKEMGRTFQLLASPSRRHFRDIVNTTHYHGPFALDTKQVGQQDLKERVPTVGLSMVDWRKEGRPWRFAGGRKGKGVRLGELWEQGAVGGVEVGVGIGVGGAGEGG